jgi:hypothetical protein
MSTNILSEEEQFKRAAPRTEGGSLALRGRVQIQANSQPADESHILELPKDQIPPTLIFHPGCRVICINFDEETTPVVSYGTVLHSAIDLRSVSRGYLYKVRPTLPAGQEYYSEGENLAFAQGSKVWAKISKSEGYVESLVFSCERQSHDEQPVYAVTRPFQQGLYTRICAKDVKYRPEGSNRPIVEEEDDKMLATAENEDREELRSNFTYPDEPVAKQAETGTPCHFISSHDSVEEVNDVRGHIRGVSYQSTAQEGQRSEAASLLPTASRNGSRHFLVPSWADYDILKGMYCRQFHVRFL